MKSMLNVFILMLFCATVLAQKSRTENKSGWTAVYSHDENGNATMGELNLLFDGLRKGYSLKIGWSWTKQLGDSTVTLEHFAEPIFLSIIQEKYVSAIINPHPFLKNYIDITKQEFDNPKNIWQCVLTTKGAFNAMIYSAITGEVVKNWPQKHKMTWFLEYP